MTLLSRQLPAPSHVFPPNKTALQAAGMGLPLLCPAPTAAWDSMPHPVLSARAKSLSDTALHPAQRRSLPGCRGGRGRPGLGLQGYALAAAAEPADREDAAGAAAHHCSGAGGVGVWGGWVGKGRGKGRPGSAWAVNSKRPSCVCRMCSYCEGNGVSFAGPRFLRSALASWLRLCSGDLRASGPAAAPSLIPACTLLSLSCPTQGAAAGGGFALALASDVRVASRDARFSAAFVRLGLTGTDMGCALGQLLAGWVPCMSIGTWTVKGEGKSG